MERFVFLAFTLLCIYVTFSCAEETKERTIPVTHLESQPNNRCPDGSHCPEQRCCQMRGGGYGCCSFGMHATCCLDRIHCCPLYMLCRGTVCVRPFLSVLGVQAAVLVNSTGKLCRNVAAGIDVKAAKRIPSQQIETAKKRSGFIGTSGDVSSHDKKYQCPEGTSTCEFSSGIDGCCPIQNAKWIKIKIMDTIPHPHSPEDADPEAEARTEDRNEA